MTRPRIIRKIIIKIKSITLPGFDGMPLFDVGSFFISGLMKGSLTTRASSIAFNFFLAVFPAIIFFFTLIPYIPIHNFQGELMSLLKDVLPQNAFSAVSGTLEDIVMKKHHGLLSIGFIAALYFSTNGINAMIGAFNATYLSFETRKWWNQRLISLFLVLILFLLLTLAISLIVFNHFIFDYLVSEGILKTSITYYTILIGRWVVIIGLIFFAVSFLYYFAPAKKTKWRFISAGSTLSTLLIIATSLAFSYYVNHFGQYNKLYGSIGTLIVIMLWLYFNGLALLIGFELNTSINNAHLKKSQKLEILQ